MTVKRKKKSTTKGKSSMARRGVNVAKAREKAEELDARFSGSYHELKEGPNWFYILPPWDGSEVAWEELQQHGINICRKSRGHSSCYGCDRVKSEEKRGNEKFVRRWRKQTKGLFNAIRKLHLKKKDPENVKTLRVSGRVFQEILEEIIDVQDITIPDAAVLVCIRRKGTGMQTRYTVKFGKETDLSRYLTDDVLNAARDLAAGVDADVPSDKEIKKAMRKDADDFGGDSDEDDFADDDDDEIDDEDSDDDEGDQDDEFADDEEADDEEAEEEEDEEDELGEEEEEEEEEEPAPKRRKKKVTKKKATKKKATKKKARR